MALKNSDTNMVILDGKHANLFFKREIAVVIRDGGKENREVEIRG